MFGLIGKMRATPGKRAELIAILSDGTQAMPGCIHYIVAEDEGEPGTGRKATRLHSSSRK